ncbi:MAG TPA: hypothetical protein VGO57_14295 [Verrucomicrobiae bacterium]|jgi:hypothetical protein
MNNATIVELPPALCIANQASFALLLSRNDVTMTAAKLYVGKNLDFSGGEPSSYTLLQTLTAFAWHGQMSGNYPDTTLYIDQELGCTVVLDGPDLILPDVTATDSLENKLLLFNRGEILSIISQQLIAPKTYKLFCVRGRFATEIQFHQAGDEIFILQLVDLAPFTLPSALPSNQCTFKLVRGVDNLEDQNGVDVVFAGLSWHLPPPAMVQSNGIINNGQFLAPDDTLDIEWILPDCGNLLPRQDFVKPATRLDFYLGATLAHTEIVAWPATSVSIPWTTITDGDQQDFLLVATTQVDTGDVTVAGQGLNSTVTAAVLTPDDIFDDVCAIFVNGTLIRTSAGGSGSDPASFDLVALATTAGIRLKIGDLVTIFALDNFGVAYVTTTWTAMVTFFDGVKQTVTGGQDETGPSVIGTYYPDGQFIIARPTI